MSEWTRYPESEGAYWYAEHGKVQPVPLLVYMGGVGLDEYYADGSSLAWYSGLWQGPLEVPTPPTPDERRVQESEHE